MNAIDIANLTVSYNGKPVVDDLGLQVPDGGWTCLIGPNGSGKTSVLRAIAGLVDAVGHIRIQEQDTKKMSRKAFARALAMVPQTPLIPTGMAVGDYALLGRTPYLSILRNESPKDLQKVGEVLQRLGLTGLATRMMTRLSGGELQRAILARALAQQSPLLLLDEPTTGLDIGHQQEVLELVDRLRHEGTLTVLSAMHDLTLAGQFADDLLMLRQGRVVAHGPPEQVLTEDSVRENYGASVRVTTDGAGRPVVTPSRPPRGGATPPYPRTPTPPHPGQ